MNFNKIEMQGFKSFADATRIQFDSEVTAIVGPNGCGKSNVADAIRWVLGEQSAKTLRGKSMQDVIFNGTESRKSTSYCEVSLFFDNKTKLFNIGYDELVLTRKLDRSGDSEYLINKNPCRLRDIIDLLRDTGVGREGYSIIGQGRIDEILSAKPDDRRNIFEEAAGIAKSKSKKIEAERKLERARENLSRHQDIMGELFGRLEPLKKQAEDAERCQTLKDELKLNEVNAYIYQYENNAKERIAIEDRIRELSEALSALRASYNEITFEFNESLSGMGGADAEIAALREQLTALLVEAEKNAGEVKLKNEKIGNLKNESDRLKNEIARESDELSQKKRSGEACLAESDELRGRITNKESVILRADGELNALKESLKGGESRVEDSNKSILENMTKLSDIKANMSQLLKEKELLEQRLESLLTKTLELKEAILSNSEIKANFAAEADRLKKSIDDCEFKLASIGRRTNEKQFAIDKASAELKTLSQRIAALETKSKMLEDIKNEYEGYAYPVKKLMTDGKSNGSLREKTLGVLAELIKVEEKYEQAIDTALGAALQNIVTKTEEDAKFLIDYLKEKRYGRVTFLPLSSVKPRLLEKEYDGVLRFPGCFGVASELISYDKLYQGIVRNLLGRTVIVDVIDTAIAMAKRYNYAFKIVTLEGDVFMPSGAITGGSKKSDSNAEIISRDRNIAQVKTLLKDSVLRHGILDKALRSAESEIAALKKDSADAQAILKKDEPSYAALLERIDKTVAHGDALQRETEELISETESVKKRIGEITSDVGSVDKLEADIQRERKNIDELREEDIFEVDQKKREREMLEESLTKARILLSQMKKDLDAGEALKERLDEEARGAVVRILCLEGELGRVSESLSVEEAGALDAAMSADERERIALLKERLDGLDRYKAERQKNITRLEENRNIKNQEISDANERKIREENLLERLETDSSTLAVKVSEEYGLEYRTALGMRLAEYDYQKSLTAINRLKRKLNELGDVNMLAVNEYAEAGARYDGMLTQRDDMQTAEADLLKIINDLTGEMHAKFKTEFDKINENFMVIFKQLFGGGRGKLQLEETPDKDILNAGIEIYAEPPGKKLQHISLLSGGEKALTAIAILFAILKLKPMPFCVLDEIEAALDDSNANLFAEYLKKFSANTQFIVITHRKPTMELADTLYGVTMEEKGVSKLVSVQLSEAVSRLGDMSA